MQADAVVLLDTVVEGRRLPCLGKEDHADRLAKIVQLQTSSPYRGHDGSIVDRPDRYVKLTRAEHKVGVSGGASLCQRCMFHQTQQMIAPEWVSYDQECDVNLARVFQDLIAGRLHQLSVGYQDRAAIVGFLLSGILSFAWVLLTPLHCSPILLD